MSKKNQPSVIPDEIVINKIYLIRDEKVMLDSDLAELYGVETKRLNEQVKRNIDRFPEDFMFQLTETEFENLKSQIATSSWGGRRTLPYVFTEHGVLMLSSVLNSDLAIKVNIQIMRVYTKIRNMLATHKDLLLKFEQFETRLSDHDEKIMLIFEYLKQLEKSKQEELEYRNRQQIGYKSNKKK
ncbi:MAG: ORF6N domain-containing protein [Bacteroidetes bacterium]|nr:MAG: ORF6N domain-containing protein [Bacteroidota bacterium]